MTNLPAQSRLSLVSCVALFVASAVFAGTATSSGLKSNSTGAKVGAVAAANTSTTNVVDQNSETLRAKFARLFPGGGLLDSNGSLRRVWGTTFSHGNSPSDSADKFMREWSMLWKVPYTQIEKFGPFEDGAHTMPLVTADDGESSVFTAAYWRQHASGVPVFRSYVWGLVRNEDQFPMVLAGGTLRNIGDIETQLEGQDLDASSINIGLMGSQALNQFRSPPEMTSPRYVIWSGLDEDVQTAQLAVEFTATGGGAFDSANHQKILFVVDSTNGNILYQESQILHGTVTGQVNEYVTTDYRADACSAEVIRGLPYAKVLVGTTTVYTDTNGAFTSTYTGTGSVVVTPSLVGKYFRVLDQSIALGTVASQTLNNGGSGTFLFNPSPSIATTAQTNAYEIANRTREMILAANASYPTISTQLSFSIYTNIADSCNAYYDGASINFFSAGGGCNNTAFGDIVAHELGHHQVNCAGSGQSQYGEGQADVIGIMITDLSTLGLGFSSCSSGIRNANNNCQFVSGTGLTTCGNEIHAAGQLISGCVWNLRNSFKATYPSDYRSRLAKLCVNATLLHVGSSTIENDIAVDYLTMNDTNGTIGDGTPDYNAIANAFNAHGLTAPPLALLGVQFPDGLPNYSAPTGTTPVKISVSALGTTPSNTATMYVKAQGASVFSTIPMTALGGNVYSANLPSAECGTSLSWYVEVPTSGGLLVRMPAEAPASPYQTAVAESLNAVLQDYVETNQGWVLGVTTDTATLGKWVRGDPLGTQFQPENDHTENGVNCFFTGQGTIGGVVGEADVDSGRTTLMTPIYDLTGFDEATLSFWYWYSNNGSGNPNEDAFLVQVSSTGGAPWIQMEAINTNLNAWSLKQYQLSDYIPLSADVRVRFIALDEGAGGSLVEAAVDDVFIGAVNCPSVLFGDLNNDGSVNSADLGIQLGNFGICTATPCLGDLNSDDVVDSSDTGLLLANFN